MTVADRIRKRREELGLTQEELAKKMGYTGKSSISKIETAGNDITSKKIVRVAEALGVSHRYLMGWEEGPAVLISEEIMPTVTKEELEMLTSFRELDEYGQNDVMNRIEELHILGHVKGDELGASEAV